MQSIQSVTQADFQSKVLKGKGPIAVEFMSHGCSHCNAIEPVLEDVVSKIQNKETLFQVDTDVEQELCEKYEISGTPTFVMFLDGKAVGRAVGPAPTLSGVMEAITEPFPQLN